MKNLLKSALIFLGLIFAVFSFFAINTKNTPDTLAQTVDQNYKIKLIYFYPLDTTLDQRYVNAVNPFVKDVQAWYLEKVGKTFDYTPVQVVKGNKTAAGYGTGTDSYYAIYNELKARIDSSAKTNFVVYVPPSVQFSCCAVFFGTGSYQSTTGNGFAMIDDAVFDADIVGPGGTCRNGDAYNATAACSPNSRRGGTAHEIGHMLSLPHPEPCDTANDCYQTVMFNWWSYPTVGFLNTTQSPEKNALLNSPWIWRTHLGPIVSPTSTPTLVPTRTPTPTRVLTITPTPTRALSPTKTPTPVQVKAMTLNGRAPARARLEAIINNTVCGSATASFWGTYSMQVLSATSRANCGTNGVTVKFRRNGQNVTQSTTFQAGVTKTLNF